MENRIAIDVDGADRVSIWTGRLDKPVIGIEVEKEGQTHRIRVELDLPVEVLLKVAEMLGASAGRTQVGFAAAECRREGGGWIATNSRMEVVSFDPKGGA
jgi:hypothetical protein